ncbi:MAG: NmrA family NAD(P)-binding protein [Muribaculaceae bacterium]|nr:NmrA family NAD(P)-binding protein [Muribaculaceae bacterium]
MKILVTSSTGLTGKAVVKALAQSGHQVRAMVHRNDKAAEMEFLSATEIFTGDVSSQESVEQALTGVDMVYYICPTAREDEADLGKMAVKAAQKSGIKRFIYQSVLHSVEPSLPHHRQKLEVERYLIDSGLPYTIVQPAPFMQNLMNAKQLLTECNIFMQKFFTSYESVNRLNLFDASDLGECVAKIADSEQYCYATLELCGPQNLSVSEMLTDMSEALGKKEVKLEFITDEALADSMHKRGATQYAIDTLLSMFRHYNTGDFCGSSFTVRSILDRQPSSLSEFLRREI